MLVSPGQEITIIDDSQYVSSSVGTVPFILLATAQDKTFQGLPAAYTSKANAGQLLSFSSQRDMITNLGYPLFKQSSAGTPLNAYETNEYGLMAGYSAMGVSNKSFVIRADIDLAQLEGTAVRPIGLPLNGTMWLDLSNSTWGVFEWNKITQSFANKVPMLITDLAQLDPTPVNGVSYPLSTVGAINSYAIVISSSTGAITAPLLFYKGSNNQWVQVGSTSWQNIVPSVIGSSISNPSSGITAGNIVINGSTITTSTSLDNTISAINSAAILGVSAGKINGNQLVFYVTSNSESNGSAVDGKISIVDGTTPTLSSMGITAGTYASPATTYGSYVSVPDWRTTDAIPRPTGSVWMKTSTLGNGANLVIKEFNASNDAWTTLAAPIYLDDAAAIYALDPVGGGNNIVAGTIYVKEDALDNLTASYRPFYRKTQGGLKVTGTAVSFTSTSFTASDTFILSSTESGSFVDHTVTIATTGDASVFVNAINSLSIPNILSAVETSGAISISHTAGGSIILKTGTGTPLTAAGFTTSTTGLQSIATGLLASNFAPLVYEYLTSTPYVAPADGTLWFYNSPLDVDIMVNDNGWKGYRSSTLTTDARGYSLGSTGSTDKNGPILAPVAPTTQSDGISALVGGDLWINTGDLANFPVIYRYTGTAVAPNNTWVLIDNTDSVDQNGILFADARWSADGKADPLNDGLPSIPSLLASDYIDEDAPDYRLYARGTLLFNLRRSGYNVKHYVSDYFNSTSFPSLPAVPGAASSLSGLKTSTWVTSSGLMNNGAPYMGAAAQRAMVVKALRAAIDGSDTLREESFQFNLITCPGYPELIPDMVNLNNDRKNTAFVIGDTPMHLAANGIDVTNWSTDANGDGLATADPYMGVYYPSGLTTDLSGNNIVVPPSHMVLRAAIKSDNVSYPWFAFAGTRRGLVDNCSDIGYVDANSGEFVRNGINQGMRDTLYPLAINPITLLSGVGLTVFGNKTRVGVASSLDRVNVARLVNYIRTILASVGNAYLFEPDDKTTWDSIAQVISSAMNDLVTKRAIYDYAVVCDSSNNTPQRIANNELYVDIAIEPEKDVEFIYIPIRLMNPGAIASGGK